jgi:toxin ParE1/3/4
VRRYLLTPEAEQDLDVIKVYLLREGGSHLARHVLNRLRQAMDFLGRMPGVGHSREDLTSEPVKFWQEFSFMIVYDPVPRPVHVVRVLHSHQDIASILTRD